MNKDLPKKQRLSSLQMLIMEMLWKHGELSTYDIYQQFEQKGRKDMSFTADYSGRDRSSASGPSSFTIERELRIMKMRGLVANRGRKTQLLYQPLVTAEAVTLSVADHLVNRMGASTVPKGLFDSAQAPRPSARLRQED